MAEMSEREFTAVDVEARREGDWIIVTLAGDTVLRRLTRDRAFTSAWVIFDGSRSPDYPKTREHFSRVELRGAWPFDRKHAHWCRNHIEAPIITNEGENHGR